MRIIYSSSDQIKATNLSNFLKSKEIDNQFEATRGSDYGNADYGITTFHIWVIDEDKLDEALKWRDEFQEDPENPIFKNYDHKLKLFDNSNEVNKLSNTPSFSNVNENEPQKMGFVTLYIMITCIMLFLFASLTPESIKYPANMPFAPFTTAPVNKTLMYDYPKAFDILDEVIKTYGTEKIINQDLQESGNQLIEKFHNTPYWQGLYDHIVLYFKNVKNPWDFKAPLFEKIKEGQVWRLVTPILMHGSFFHIVFNLILFVILGKQMENKIGSVKYLIFILLTAIFSNTAQYLMTGTSFLGISGVVCAMIGFIFVRQKLKPWEGYQFSSVSLSSVFIFIMMMFCLQIISFLSEIHLNTSISPGIANTAHLSGLFIGMLLGFTNIFKLQNE